MVDRLTKFLQEHRALNHTGSRFSGIVICFRRNPSTLTPKFNVGLRASEPACLLF